MGRRQKSPSGGKKPFRPVATFFKIVISIVLVFCVAAGVAAYACIKMGVGASGENNEPKSGKDLNMVDALLKKDVKLNVAVFGVDGDGTRTDVMFVVHFDSANKRIGLVSLPRDSRVELTDEIKQSIKDGGRRYESPTKLNAVHSYSPKEIQCENTVLQIENLLNINIDHYVKVNLDAFRKIVDIIGGVEVDVPQNMDYEDPYQDLYIHLKAGVQTLDGDKAEQLVRFRHYPDGDVGRVQVQQMFMNEFMRKVVSSETILKNLPDYISLLYSDVTTDVTLVDALKYVNYVGSIDMNNVTMETLPGVGQMIGSISYFVVDEDATKEMVDRIFYGIGVPVEGEAGAEVVSDSKGLSIEVSNGGSVQGLAGRTKTRLEEAGFTITSVTNYTGQKTDDTRIIVGSPGMGEDLKEYFSNATVEINETMLVEGIDIKIIIGTGQAD